jgi:hypothetical protein
MLLAKSEVLIINRINSCQNDMHIIIVGLCEIRLYQFYMLTLAGHDQ